MSTTRYEKMKAQHDKLTRQLKELKRLMDFPELGVQLNACLAGSDMRTDHCELKPSDLMDDEAQQLNAFLFTAVNVREKALRDIRVKLDAVDELLNN